MRSGQRASRNWELAEDEYEDEEGNLFRCYPIHDNPELVAPLPSIRIPRGGVVKGGQEGG